MIKLTKQFLPLILMINYIILIIRNKKNKKGTNLLILNNQILFSKMKNKDLFLI